MGSPVRPTNAHAQSFSTQHTLDMSDNFSKYPAKNCCQINKMSGKKVQMFSHAQKVFAGTDKMHYHLYKSWHVTHVLMKAAGWTQHITTSNWICKRMVCCYTIYKLLASMHRTGSIYSGKKKQLCSLSDIRGYEFQGGDGREGGGGRGGMVSI